MKTRFLSLLITMCIGILSFGAVPVSAASSGICGANVRWTLDDNGTLTISGTGKMYNYSITESKEFIWEEEFF